MVAEQEGKRRSGRKRRKAIEGQKLKGRGETGWIRDVDVMDDDVVAPIRLAPNFSIH